MKAKWIRFHEIEWIEPPGHSGALSKLLVNPVTTETRYFDFRTSLYHPKAMVEKHAHEQAEHVYHVVSGHGLMTLDGERHVLQPYDTVFIPPGVAHQLVNNGVDDLVFVVATSPPGELPVEDVRASRNPSA